MTISGVSNNSYIQFSNYNTTGTYANSTSGATSSQQEQGVQGANGKPGGPPPPPKGGGKGSQGGPNLDTDNDGLWSTEELEEFATSATSEMGIEIDTESILSTYDTDGDGSINTEERVNLGRDNAFNLPSPKDLMNQMKGFSSPHEIQRAGQTTSGITESSETTNSEIIQQLIEAYNQQSDSLYTDVLGTSVSYDV